MRDNHMQSQPSEHVGKSNGATFSSGPASLGLASGVMTCATWRYNVEVPRSVSLAGRANPLFVFALLSLSAYYTFFFERDLG